MNPSRCSESRDSEVEWLGQMPVHWKVGRLKRHFHLLTEKTARREHPIGLENIESWTGRWVPTEGEFQGEGVAVEHGDLLFGKLRPYLAKVLVAERAGEAVGDFHVMRPAGTLNARFAQYLMLTREFISIVDGSTFGAKMPRASWEFVGSLPLPIPPLLEQNAITGFLDWQTTAIDDLVGEQQLLIELLKEKRQALISHAVTKGLNHDAPMKPSGIEWLGDVPAHWDVIGLTKYLSSVVDYRGRTPTKVEDGVFLLTARNIRDGKIDYGASEEFIAADEYDAVMSRGKPQVGDVVFTTEAPLGQVANLDRNDLALAQRIIKFRGEPGIVDNYFLKYWIMGSHCQANLEQLATGSTALGIKGSKVGQVRFCLPPHEEQRLIATFLDQETEKFDQLVAEAERAIALLQERRSALIFAAVTGKIDVRGFAGDGQI